MHMQYIFHRYIIFNFSNYPDLYLTGGITGTKWHIKYDRSHAQRAQPDELSSRRNSSPLSFERDCVAEKREIGWKKTTLLRCRLTGENADRGLKPSPTVLNKRFRSAWTIRRAMVCFRGLGLPARLKR